MSSRNDLALELRYGVPPFRLALPAGWVGMVPNAAAEQEDLRRASAIFRQAGRPDLDAEFRHLMAQSSQGIRRAKVFTIYRQQDVPMEELLPLSITASALVAPDGENLDAWVTEGFRLKGAEFLDGDLRHIVRWSSESNRPAAAPAMDGVSARTVTYVIPVPGTTRRKALVFTATIVIPDGDVIPADVLDGIELLSDAMISTFAWEQVQAEPAVPVAADRIRSNLEQ